jgi:hypothetical protein
MKQSKKNTYILKLFSLLILGLLSVYLLGFNTTMSYITYFIFLLKENKLYLYIIGLIINVFLILYFIISLYILHTYSFKKELGEKIYISKTLPDFVIKALKELKSFSTDEILLKEIKRMYYIQIVIYSFLSLFWIGLIYFA